MQEESLSKDKLKNVDYQVKKNELLKEMLFLQQYGTRTMEGSVIEHSSEIEK